LRAIVVYFLLVLFVRLGKKRFLGQATAFDAVLIILIGSIASRAVSGTAPFVASLAATLSIRQVEVFAAYAAYSDHEIGRVIQAFQDLGKLDNTLIIYINGDNGTSAEGGPQTCAVQLGMSAKCQ
jgi:hypothetical protein